MFFYRTFVRFENVKLKNFVVLNKYVSSYLLTNTNFRRSFICRIHLRPRMRNGCHILKQTFHF